MSIKSHCNWYELIQALRYSLINSHKNSSPRALTLTLKNITVDITEN